MNHQLTDEHRDRLRRIAEDDTPFAEILGRVRADIRGEKYDTAKHHPELSQKSSRYEVPPAYDDSLQSLVSRFMDRAKTMPADAQMPEPPRKAAPSAAEVRIGWYIAPRHTNDTLDSFVPHTASQESALRATRAWIGSVKDGKGGALALIGSVGCGKSHLLYAAIRHLNTAGIHAAAGGWYDLADMIRQSKFGHDEDHTEARRRRDRFLAARAFGIDEIRPTSGTAYDTTELSQLMTRAYRECQGVIVTSNHADEKLARIIGLAAASRLTQVQVIGPDLRQPANRHLRAG